MPLHFQDAACANPKGRALQFPGYSNKIMEAVTICEVSVDALLVLAGNDNSRSAVEIFVAFAPLIHEIASDHYDAGAKRPCVTGRDIRGLLSALAEKYPE